MKLSLIDGLVKMANGLASRLTRYHTFGLFLWGYIKDNVYATPVPVMDTLKRRINNTFSTITEEMLVKTYSEMEYQLDILRATSGAHVEIY